MNYNKFLRWCYPLAVRVDMAAERLRAYVAEHARERYDSDLSASFEEFFGTRGGSGKFSRGDLSRALQRLGIDLSQDEIIALSGEMDRDGDGEIDYADFREFVLGQESETFSSSSKKKGKKKKKSKGKKEEGGGGGDGDGDRASSSLARSPEWYDSKLGEIARRIRVQLRRDGHEGGGQWFRFFNSYDSEGDGLLSRSQFREAMDELLLHGPKRRRGEGEGTALSPGDYASLFSAFDANGSGKISIHEFRKLLEYVSQPAVQADSLIKQVSPVDIYLSVCLSFFLLYSILLYLYLLASVLYCVSSSIIFRTHQNNTHKKHKNIIKTARHPRASVRSRGR